MILTVTLNAALDVTYSAPGWVVDATNRVGAVASRAGGKGVNVARVVAAVGRDALALVTAGGPEGADLATDLAADGIPYEAVPVSGRTRRTVAVVDGTADTVTLFNEPGPELGPSDWRAIREAVERHLPSAKVVVLSGSLPPGLPRDAYAVLSDLARAYGVPVIVDAEADALALALAARPDVVKPNRAELARTVAHLDGEAGTGDLRAGADRLRAAGAGSVVVSDGPDGLLAVTPDGVWRAVPPRSSGNPTGAGDAAVAALALGVADGRPWPELLAEAAALSAAAVRAPLAGQLDPDSARDARDGVRVLPEEPPCP